MIVVNAIWDDFLFQQVSECRQNIRIATPELSVPHVREILKAKRTDVVLEVATSFGIAEFYHGKTDLDAVEALVRGKSSITGVPGLEAIFAVFDYERSFVSSGNLTTEGPASERSYNILIDNPYVSKQLATDFDLLVHSEPAHLFSLNVIDEYREIIRRLRNNERTGLNKAPANLPTLSELLENVSVTGWTLNVLQVVINIEHSLFCLEDVYAFSERLQVKYPQNNHVQDKIRQQLQRLRDLNLIEFVDNNGNYRKLWRDEWS